MIEGLVDFGKLDTHVKSCGRPFREAVVGYFKKLGEERGYSIRENSPFVKYGLSLGRITLAWVETKTLFFCEFANLDDIIRDLCLAVEFNPDEVVFVLSGKSKASPQAVEKLVLESQIAAVIREKTVIVDVTGRKIKSLRP